MTSGASLLQMANRICSSLEKSALPHQLSPFGIVTVSIGVATFDPHKQQLENYAALIQKADKALFCAKKQGRNQAVLSELSASAY